MKGLLRIVRNIVGIAELRNRILMTFALLGVFRIGFHIYLPGVNIDVIKGLLQRKGEGWNLLDLLGYTSALTGGDLSNATIFSLGIMPYISASIIFSLLVKVFPKLEALSKEGEHGRRIINRYTRYFTVLLCLIQAGFIVVWLRRLYPAGPSGETMQSISDPGYGLAALQLLCLTAGSVFLMWLGEKITEYGIGNGSSLIITAGIVARMPQAVYVESKRLLESPSEERPFQVVSLLLLVALFIIVVLCVVYITRGERRIQIQQARTVKGRRVYGGVRHFMPLRVNSAGVLPIIFAQSLVVIPAGFLKWVFPGSQIPDMVQPGAFWYYVLYLAMIGFFTYFWTSLTFNPVEIANNIKEHGSFIPGIRPGRRTAEYLERILNRITLAGATFLAIIALVPQMISESIGVTPIASSFLGGTGILIVVGVALDLVDKVEAQLLVRHYDGFMRKSGEA